MLWFDWFDSLLDWLTAASGWRVVAWSLMSPGGDGSWQHITILNQKGWVNKWKRERGKK